ncbi:uncharacterized protein ELE39_001542 [Cryptosporidium sp. chipmunk genotype I]|uniref:uncharacterized protein n=1 Tax=Cryptosporidium sp. chipmunk genotype I TaxID=1280935 RepID=UPI00351A73C8|nr:hypothetical protein ELE39_001542 [Cryptosporidium sp. chipmunk genotype I]
MFFDKKKLAELLNPFRRKIRENCFKINTFNRNCFDLFRNKNGFRFNYTIFSISISIALLTNYYQNTSKQLSTKEIASNEIETLSLKSRNMIVLNLIKGMDPNKSNFIRDLIKQIRGKELNKLNIDIYYTQDNIYSQSVPNAILFKGYGSAISNVDLNFRNNHNIEKIKSFFVPISEKIINSNSSIVKNISHNTFENEVINASNQNKPLLLMYYDDYCLMCFLVRPLINSLAIRLRGSTSIKFARYNIERNDLHEFSPLVKATPTFVLFRGRQEPEKWDEYKPGDLISKIIEIEYGAKNNNCDNNMLAELKALEQKVLIRFQLFTILNIWNLYLKELQNTLINTPKNQIDKLNFIHIEDLLFISSSLLQNRNFSSENGDHFNDINLEKISYEKIAENNNFQRIFFDNIKQDMKRSDTIEENIDYLLNEIKGCCNDYIAMKSLIKKS